MQPRIQSNRIRQEANQVLTGKAPSKNHFDYNIILKIFLQKNRTKNSFSVKNVALVAFWTFDKFKKRSWFRHFEKCLRSEIISVKVKDKMHEDDNQILLSHLKQEKKSLSLVFFLSFSSFIGFCEAPF